MSYFQKIKEQYNNNRECERRKIIDFLINKNNSQLKVSKYGGNGKRNYTSGGKLSKSYDLSNWKWIVVSKDENEYFISLQTFDRDKNSQNYHVLMDRIGICKYNKFINKPDYFNLMKLTSLELPLNDRDLEDLYELLIDDDKFAEL